MSNHPTGSPCTLYISSQVDDDSFVVVDKLYDELKHTNYPSGLYWGFFDGRAPVIRGEKERYRETEYVNLLVNKLNVSIITCVIRN